VAIGDFNGDGALDVAIADNLEKGSVVILLNRNSSLAPKQ